MAVTVTSSVSGPFVPNGVATVFPFDFKAGSAAEVSVYRVADEGWEEVPSADYTASVDPDQEGGSVEFSVAPATGSGDLYIASTPSFSREGQYTGEGPFTPKGLNNQLDKAAVRDIYLKGQIDRSLRVPDGEEASPLPSVSARASKYAAWDALGRMVGVAGMTDLIVGAALGAALGATSMGAYASPLLTDNLSAKENIAQLAGHIEALTKADLYPTMLASWNPLPGADNTVAIQAAIDTGYTIGGANVVVPTNVNVGALTLKQNVCLKGIGTRSKLTFAAGNYVGITINGSDTAIRDLTFVSTAKTGGADITIACGTTGKDRIEISNIITYGSWGFITDSGAGAGVHTTTLISDCQWKALRGQGIDMTRLFAFGWFSRCTADYVGVAGASFTGFRWNLGGLGGAAGGMNIIDCHTLGTMGVSNANQKHCEISNTSAVWIVNTMGDTIADQGGVGGDCWTFTNVNGLHVSGMIASLMNGHGIVCTNVSGEIAGFVAAGRNYLAGFATNKDGIRLVSGCAALKFVSPVVRNMSGHAFNQVAAQAGACSVSDPSFFDNTGRAVKAVGGSPLHITVGQFAGNVAGEYDLDHALQLITYTQGNGGGRILQQGPAVG